MINQDRPLRSLRDLLSADGIRDASEIRAAIEQETLLGLGSADPLADTSYDNHLLQFSLGDDARTFVPVFTSTDELGGALKNSPEWGALAILEIPGRSLLQSLRQTGVNLVVNPWSPMEFYFAV